MRLPPLPRRTPSVALRVKLVAAVLALVMIALLVIGTFSAVAVRRFLVERIDAQLTQTSSSVNMDAIVGANPSTMRDSIFAAFAPSGEWLLISARDERHRPQLPSTREKMRERANTPYTVASRGGSERWRLMIRVWPDGTIVIVGQSLAAVDETVDHLIAAELIVGVGVLAVLASVGVGIVQASLRPLTEIEHTAKAIAAGDLTRRVPESDPDTEVGALASALNVMLAQIEGAFAARSASEERMRAFVADASHELRTPLTTIRGFAELYRQGAARSPEETEAILKRIEGEASRMGLLVEDLLLLARLDQQRPLTLSPVELRVLASDAVAAARAVAPDRDISLVAAESPVLVIGDEPRLRQVVGNLMTNALTHTPPGTPVVVRVLPAEGFAVLEVSDAGPGLTAEQQKQVFERFYRVDKARTRRAAGSAQAVTQHSGTGLGLAIVAALVAAHRGAVGVESEPGAGATFIVRLPLAPSPEPGEPGAAAGPRPTAAVASTAGSQVGSSDGQAPAGTVEA